MRVRVGLSAEVLGGLRTGDTILFRDGPPLSWFLKRTHVGMVLLGKSGVVYLWESVAKGVVMVPFEERMRGYRGRAWVHRMEPALTMEERERVGRAVLEIDARHVPYERNPLEFLSAKWRLVIATWPWSRRSLFCSELWALTMMEAGLVGGRWPADEYSPDHIRAGAIDWVGERALGGEELIWSA